MSWILLFVAGLCEVVWAISLKLSNGFSKLSYSILTIVFLIVSFFLLALALKKLPVGTAYAIWTGIGAAGTVLTGVIFLQEPLEILRCLCLIFILVGIVGLKIC